VGVIPATSNAPHLKPTKPGAKLKGVVRRERSALPPKRFVRFSRRRGPTFGEVNPGNRVVELHHVRPTGCVAMPALAKPFQGLNQTSAKRREHTHAHQTARGPSPRPAQPKVNAPAAPKRIVFTCQHDSSRNVVEVPIHHRPPPGAEDEHDDDWCSGRRETALLPG